LEKNKKKKQVEHFVSFKMDCSFFEGLVSREIFQQVTTYLLEDVFTPWVLLNKMDIQGHNIFLEAIKGVRAIQVRSQRYAYDCQ
jgi:hypothetical protein